MAKTTRYRLELGAASRKQPHAARFARVGSTRPAERGKQGEVKMSPLPAGAAEDPMSALGGQNVTSARLQPCHPNRQGRENIEPSEPPSNLPPPLGPVVIGSIATAEGGRELKSIEETNRESLDETTNPAAAIRAVYLGWAEREALPRDQRELFDRQAKRLADGEDLEAWTHPQKGTVVPPEDRLRVFALGLRHFRDGTSRTLRGGVMYAVAKHYRIPPPVTGTDTQLW